MVEIGEDRWQREARLTRQRERFPELRVAEAADVLAVDRLRRSEGRAPTSMGQAAESIYARLRHRQPGGPGQPAQPGGLLNSRMALTGQQHRALNEIGSAGDDDGGLRFNLGPLSQIASSARDLADPFVRGAAASAGLVRDTLTGRDLQESGRDFERRTEGIDLTNPVTPVRAAAEGTIGVARLGLEPAVLGNPIVEEVTRPANYLPVAMRGLSFAPRLPGEIRAGAEIGAALGFREAEGELSERTQGLPEPLRSGVPLAGGLAAGVAGGVGLGRAASAGQRAVERGALAAAGGTADSATAQVAGRGLGTALPGQARGNVKTVTLYRGALDPTSTADTAGNALYYSPSREFAERYAPDAGSVIKRNITFKNLLEVDSSREIVARLGLPFDASMDDLIRGARAAGFDGIEIKRTINGGPEFIHIPDVRVSSAEQGTRFARRLAGAADDEADEIAEEFSRSADEMFRRTNILRQQRGLPPLEKMPPAWNKIPRDVVEEVPGGAESADTLDAVEALAARVRAEGGTPQNADEWNRIAARVFKVAEPEPPPPASGTGVDIGNAIIRRFEQSRPPAAAAPPGGTGRRPPAPPGGLGSVQPSGRPPRSPGAPAGPAGQRAQEIAQTTAEQEQAIRTAQRELDAALAARRSRFPAPPQPRAKLPSVGKPSGARAAEIKAAQKAPPVVPAATKHGFLGNVGEVVADMLSIPRSLKSSFDISAPFRQGVLPTLAHPVKGARAFKAQLQALVSEGGFERIQADLLNKPYAALRDAAGVVVGQNEIALTGERRLIARMLDKIPGYRASQRAYITYLDVLRDDLFKSMLDSYGGNAGSIPADELARWGRLVKVSTGRGDLPGFLGGARVAGHPLFWAPRLLAARVQMPFELFSSSPIVRKEAARQIAAFVGVNTTLLATLKATGAADVELDPKSADFGQIRVGNTRVDPWGGYRPIANLVARLATGEKTSTRTGESYPVEQTKVVEDFLRGKLSPESGLALALWTGRDFFGDPLTARELAIDSLAPLFLQEMVEAVQNGGLQAAALTSLGAVGFGASTYEVSPEDEFAQAQGARSFSQLPGALRDQFLRDNPEVAEQRSRERIERGGTSGDYEQLRVDLSGEQETSDAALAERTITAQQWKDARSERLQQLVGARALAFPDDREATTPEGKYYEAIRDFFTGEDGAVNWNAVDAWVAQQPDVGEQSFGDYIDANTGLGGTETEREYRAIGKQLDASGYFDIRDRVWQRVAGRFGLGDYETQRDFEADVRKRVAKRLRDRGLRGDGQIDIIIGRVMGGLEPLQVMSDVTNDVQQAWIETNPDLASQAVAFGYIRTPLRGDEDAAILAAGTREPVSAAP